MSLFPLKIVGCLRLLSWLSLLGSWVYFGREINGGRCHYSTILIEKQRGHIIISIYFFMRRISVLNKFSNFFWCRGKAKGIGDPGWGWRLKIKKDPRIFPFIGTPLRKTGLDELPQLMKMLKGEMRLVGPRPPIPSEVKDYDVWQRRRLSMKPGLTCIWQVTQNRNEVSFDQWMKMDLSYIDKWSLGLDFKILFKTARAVLMGAGH